MRKLPECDRCLLYSNEPFLVCAVHPTGPGDDSCLDFRLDPDLENRFEDFLGLERQTGAVILDCETPIENPFGPDEEQWQPEGAFFVNGDLVIDRDNDNGASLGEHRSFYNGEEIVQPRFTRWTREEQLELLDYHPMFTGRCPECGSEFARDYRALMHWDCPHCGWVDDTV